MNSFAFYDRDPIKRVARAIKINVNLMRARCRIGERSAGGREATYMSRRMRYLIPRRVLRYVR